MTDILENYDENIREVVTRMKKENIVVLGFGKYAKDKNGFYKFDDITDTIENSPSLIVIEWDDVVDTVNPTFKHCSAPLIRLNENGNGIEFLPYYTNTKTLGTRWIDLSYETFHATGDIVLHYIMNLMNSIEEGI